MNIVVAVDENGGIGYQGDLLVSIPLDHQRFRKQTINKVVVMGRKNAGKSAAGTAARTAGQHHTFCRSGVPLPSCRSRSQHGRSAEAAGKVSE